MQVYISTQSHALQLVYDAKWQLSEFPLLDHFKHLYIDKVIVMDFLQL